MIKQCVICGAEFNSKPSDKVVTCRKGDCSKKHMSIIGKQRSERETKEGSTGPGTIRDITGMRSGMLTAKKRTEEKKEAVTYGCVIATAEIQLWLLYRTL
ncbi:hypothetical protein LJC61_09370 [Ruminococcaceae bacterium OttesenSCG-928-A16]|nr:hypothetical protein [Ruminococcaceae bacterium OttesenSCG-928-A16]